MQPTAAASKVSNTALGIAAVAMTSSLATAKQEHEIEVASKSPEPKVLKQVK